MYVLGILVTCDFLTNLLKPKNVIPKCKKYIVVCKLVYSSQGFARKIKEFAEV
jgi:hypothetical protein